MGNFLLFQQRSFSSFSSFFLYFFPFFFIFSFFPSFSSFLFFLFFLIFFLRFFFSTSRFSFSFPGDEKPKGISPIFVYKIFRIKEGWEEEGKIGSAFPGVYVNTIRGYRITISRYKRTIRGYRITILRYKRAVVHEKHHSLTRRCRFRLCSPINSKFFLSYV